MKHYLVIDTETGGFDAETCGLTEIGALLLAHAGDWDAPEVVSRFRVLIRPNPVLRYHASALAVQHRTLADLQRGLPEEVALLRFYIWAIQLQRYYGAIPVYVHCDRIAGTQTLFDLAFLLAAHARLNEEADPDAYLPFPLGVDWRSTVDMFRRLKAAGVHTCPNATLDTVMAHYGITVAEDVRHTALADCEATAIAVACMMRDHRALPSETRAARLLDGTLGPGHG